MGVATFAILGLNADASSQVTPAWGIGIAAGAGGIFGAYLGASLQSHISESAVRRLLGGIAIVIAVRYAYLGLSGSL